MSLSDLSEQLQLVESKLQSTRNQNKEVQQSIFSLENERRDLEKEIDLTIINSEVFLEEIKKSSFQLYLDLDNPKLVNDDNPYSSVLNNVRYRLNDLIDRQIYLQDKVHFECHFGEISIHSKSMKDLLEFAKKHKLKWIVNTSKILNEEIDDLKNQLNDLNKFKRLMEKYK